MKQELTSISHCGVAFPQCFPMRVCFISLLRTVSFSVPRSNPALSAVNELHRWSEKEEKGTNRQGDTNCLNKNIYQASPHPLPFVKTGE
jgi:hypothetical protein